MFGAIWIGKMKKVQPIFSWKTMFALMSMLLGIALVGYGIDTYLVHSYLVFFIVAVLLNGLLLFLSRRPIKRIAK
jgi:hypothetical protein